MAAASGRPLEANLNAGLLVTFLLYVVLNVMTGVALGALVHNSAAVIVASFVLPIGFALLGRASQLVAEWLECMPTEAPDAGSGPRNGWRFRRAAG